MSLTAVVTSHNYAKYLPECLESAIQYCDKVVVYDDGSTDASLDVIKHYGVPYFHRRVASGGPVIGSNWGIRKTETSHLIFLDADNFLLRKPPQNDVDYTFFDVALANERGWLTEGTWRYFDRPTDWGGCRDFFIRTAAIPFPWGGVWRTSFLKGKKWRQWPTTMFAADFRTAVDWCLAKPTLAYGGEPIVAFRIHEGQWSDSPERWVMEHEAREEACRLSTSIGGTSPSPGFAP